MIEQITTLYKKVFGTHSDKVLKGFRPILNKVNAPKIIDFFSLDVEGDEIEVLRGINFKKYKFKYILIETYHLNKIKIFFNKHGYKYVKKMSLRNDHLFKIHQSKQKNNF